MGEIGHDLEWIEYALNYGLAYIPHPELKTDRFSLLEDQVWNMLYDDFLAGRIETFDLATEKFLQWRDLMIFTGGLAVRGELST